MTYCGKVSTEGTYYAAKAALKPHRFRKIPIKGTSKNTRDNGEIAMNGHKQTPIGNIPEGSDEFKLERLDDFKWVCSVYTYHMKLVRNEDPATQPCAQMREEIWHTCKGTGSTL
ncbi:MAG: hypothetical protein K8R64_08750 [Methanosarcinaceae archaeon]|nr:hypothetical protein [Methanosarcinaceae archaeon]